MLCTCVTPTKNRAKFIPQAVENFLSQTIEDKEWIVIDSGDSIEHLIPKHPQIRYVRSDATIGAARNTGTHLARGEFVFQFDDDDWYSPTRLETQLNELHTHDGIDGS